jgi:hypothetical protein
VKKDASEQGDEKKSKCAEHESNRTSRRGWCPRVLSSRNLSGLVAPWQEPNRSLQRRAHSTYSTEHPQILLSAETYLDVLVAFDGVAVVCTGLDLPSCFQPLWFVYIDDWDEWEDLANCCMRTRHSPITDSRFRRRLPASSNDRSAFVADSDHD